MTSLGVNQLFSTRLFPPPADVEVLLLARIHFGPLCVRLLHDYVLSKLRLAVFYEVVILMREILEIGCRLPQT